MNIVPRLVFLSLLAFGVSLAWAEDAPASAAMAAPDAAAPSAAATGAGVPAASEARIPFANHGGIYDWRAVDDKTVLIESLNRKWYKATLLNSCFNLPFAERIGFQSNADGSFDKFSAIQVGHQRCQVVSFVETTPPAKKPKDKKPKDKKPVSAVSTPPQAAPATSSPQRAERSGGCLFPGAAANLPRGRPQTATGCIGEGLYSCVS